MEHGSIEIFPIDTLNPDCGYTIKIKTVRGQVILDTSYNPVTGDDLLSLSDCLTVAEMYKEVSK